MSVRATATHWATRDAESGELRLIAVSDMTTAHLLRWVRKFRGILREAEDPYDPFSDLQRWRDRRYGAGALRDRTGDLR